MQKYKLRMNPLKFSSGVSSGNLLGFAIHKKGIDLDLRYGDSYNL